MSYVIRWVAMPSCSQRGSLIRSLIMERAAGEFLSPACSRKKNPEQNNIGSGELRQHLHRFKLCLSGCLLLPHCHGGASINCYPFRAEKPFVHSARQRFLNRQGVKFSCHPGQRRSPHTPRRSRVSSGQC